MNADISPAALAGITRSRVKQSAGLGFYGFEGALTAAKNWNKNPEDINVAGSAAQGAALGAGWAGLHSAWPGARTAMRGGRFAMNPGWLKGMGKGALLSAAVSGGVAWGMRNWGQKQRQQPQQQYAQGYLKQSSVVRRARGAAREVRGSDVPETPWTKSRAARAGIGTVLGAGAGYLTGGAKPLRGAAVWGAAGGLGSLFA